MTTARDLLYGLVLEDGRRWGEAATQVQREDGDAVLALDARTPFHWLGRSRGYSKTTDLAGMAIALMLAQAPERARAYGLAADQAQGALLVDAIAGFAHRTPELQGALTLQEFRVIASRTGATLTILAADSSTIWGLRPWLGVVDELTQWHDSTRARRCWEGLTTGLAKVPGSRLCVLCTAGDPAHWSKAIRDQALDDPLWRVREIGGPAPWIDRERLKGERRRLPESSYRRLFENQWTASEDRLADESDLAACVTLDGPLEPQQGVRYVIGLDVGLTNDATVAAVCHAEKIPGAEHPRIVLDRMGVWKGSRLRPVQLSEVEAWVEEASRRYGLARVRFDPYQAVHLAQRLKRSGIPVEEFTFTAASVGRLATVLLQLVRERGLALPSDDALLDELRHVRIRESSPGILRLHHDRSRHDDRVVALGLSASYLTERASSGQPLKVSGISSRYGGGRPRNGVRLPWRAGWERRIAERSLLSALGDPSPVAGLAGHQFYSREEIRERERQVFSRRRVR